MAKTAAFLAAIVMIVTLGLMLSNAGPTVAQTAPDIIAVVTATATFTPKPTPTPTPKIGQGCTPGFWKNHTSIWPSPYSPSQTVGSVFTVPSGLSSLGSATLLQALGFGGGTGVEGAARTLLRDAVAALLNSAALSSYPVTSSDVIAMTNAALASGSRSTILSQATSFNASNNLGCPLN